jgi:hypothetical protein
MGLGRRERHEERRAEVLAVLIGQPLQSLRRIRRIDHAQ